MFYEQYSGEQLSLDKFLLWLLQLANWVIGWRRTFKLNRGECGENAILAVTRRNKIYHVITLYQVNVQVLCYYKYHWLPITQYFLIE